MPKDENGRASIREVYHLTNQLHDKIDLCVTKTEFAALCKQVEELRDWKWRVTGFAGGVGAIIGVLLTTLKDMLGGK